MQPIDKQQDAEKQPKARKRNFKFVISFVFYFVEFIDPTFIYEETGHPLSQRLTPVIPLLRDEAIKVFDEWRDGTDKVGC